MFSHKILPTVSLSSRMALSLGLAVLGTGSLLFLFPSPALPDFPSLPALAEAEGRTSEPEIRKPGRLPRRRLPAAVFWESWNTGGNARRW